ncbi:MAG: histidine kinase [Clostridium sp.]|nr:histidine kinase [Clostridium sp.]
MSSKQKIKNWFGNMPIQKKLIAVLIGFVLIPTTIITLSFYITAENIIKKDERVSTENTLKQVTNNLDTKIERLTNVIYQISVDEEIQKNIEKLNNNNLRGMEKIKTEQGVKDRVIKLGVQINEIREVKIETLRQDRVIVKSALQEYTDVFPYGRIEEKKGANVWDEVLEGEVIPIYKELNNLEYQNPIGVMAVYVDKAYFYDILDDFEMQGVGMCYLLNEDGNEINGIQIPIENNKRYIYPLTNNDWSLLCIQNIDKINLDLVLIRWLAIGLFLVLVVLMVIISIAMSRTISKPIIDLEYSMKEFSRGNFDMTISAKYNDEIGNLRRCYNQMILDMGRLVERNLQEEKLKQEAQIKMLQMQINPHFFYNTLDTIHWLAQMHGENEIVEVSQAFGKLMRFSLEKNEIIPFEKELDAIDNYMKIQFYRFGNQLSLDEKVEEDLYYEYIPKHIILPIVENAIEHGFSGMEDEKKLIIRGKINYGQIIVDVFDNGCGMNKEQIEDILYRKNMSKEKHMSIGLANVQQRLALLYGEKAGVKINSKKDMGTVVSVFLPLNRRGE